MTVPPHARFVEIAENGQYLAKEQGFDRRPNLADGGCGPTATAPSPSDVEAVI